MADHETPLLEASLWRSNEWTGERRAGLLAVPPEEALNRLRDGNNRWSAGEVEHPRQDPSYREEVGEPHFHQHPFAVVFSCVDSRVPPELVFDQGLNDVLTIRTAGHVLDPVVTGSIQYGPLALDAPLIVVLGHQSCGAIAAAIAHFRDHTPVPGDVLKVVNALHPAYVEGRNMPGDDLYENVTRAQVRLTVAHLRGNADLKKRIDAGQLDIRGGIYEMNPGTVCFDA